MILRLFVCLLALIGNFSFSQDLPFPELELELVLEGLTLPTYATSAKDGSGRLFVVQLDGFVRIVQNGELLDSPFLNLDGQVTAFSE